MVRMSTVHKRKKLGAAVLSAVVMATIYYCTEHRHSDSMEARLQRMEAVCNARNSRGQTLPSTVRSGIFFNEEHRLAYCLVPKTGCTFWKRIMAFLSNDTTLKTSIRSPFDISRMYVHLQYKNGSGYGWAKVKDKVNDHFRFMFSRDPYSRLWSSYLDKFFLPDFWSPFGSRIMKRKKNASWEERACGHNVTFADFLHFSLQDEEPHWAPVSTLCDPCVFKPHLLGKMETFVRDARAVLDQASLSWILQDVDYRRYVRLELETLIDYNFQAMPLKFRRLFKCIDSESLGFRLWKTFQYNGYILDSISFQPPVPFTLESFKSLVLEASAHSLALDGERLKQQKKEALENAFNQLSQETLQRIAERYDQDFKLFGYKPRYVTEEK